MQEKTGIPVVVIPGSDQMMDENVYETFRIMGEVYQKEDRAEELIAYLEETKKDLDSRTKDIPEEEKQSVYVGGVSFKGAHGFEGTEANYAPFSAIYAKNLANETDQTGAFNIDLEQVLAWNPDVIFVDFNGMELIKQHYAENPDYYNQLKAVQEGKVYSQISFRSSASRTYCSNKGEKGPFIRFLRCNSLMSTGIISGNCISLYLSFSSTSPYFPDMALCQVSMEGVAAAQQGLGAIQRSQHSGGISVHGSGGSGSCCLYVFSCSSSTITRPSLRKGRNTEERTPKNDVISAVRKLFLPDFHPFGIRKLGVIDAQTRTEHPLQPFCNLCSQRYFRQQIQHLLPLPDNFFYQMDVNLRLSAGRDSMQQTDILCPETFHNAVVCPLLMPVQRI